MNLSLFQKPSRYINNEVNALHKRAEVNIALAFPDIYDIGMSHLGLRILYKIINDLPYASADRAFHPWLDMEKEMKQKCILLSSIETHMPLKDFDIVGFSLQYELSYTSVLNMLSLSGIPLRTEERNTGRWPLIIAGGPCTVNPLPMSPFIDAFLIGDGEDAIKEILETYRRWKKEGDDKRASLLNELTKIEGMYVPSVYSLQFSVQRSTKNSGLSPRGAAEGDCTLNSGLIKRRFIESLDSSPYPDAPIVPFTSIVHDRINMEVSRGCTMGCRFCQAGIIYRPLRERSPENILRIAESSLKNTGHEEVSFTSLSAGDYSCLLSLMKTFNSRFSDRRVSLSLPSLRVGAVNNEILREIKSVRKTGFTIAPEAATERLRNVINKDFTEEDYEKSLKALFEEGWHNLKLYFMIGLPTETHEDIEAISKMALKALKTAKMHTGRYVNINITISPFVPKAHTPFQWHCQEDINEIKRKRDFLKEVFYKKRLKFKGHNEEMSLLEAVFARGDERLSALIERAWALGCRLDAWTDSFDFNKWVHAMEATGIDAASSAEKIYEKNELLTWDIIDTGIKKEYLQKEYQKALSGEITPDCRKTCHGCGLRCETAVSSQKSKVREQIDIKPYEIAKNSVQISNLKSQISNLHVRAGFSKTGNLRYLSHLELITAILRVLRRAEIPIAYSKGFHPSPRVSFGPALGVGVAGMREYFDMELMSSFDLDYLMQKINSVMPDGLKINNMALISVEEQSLNSFISRYEYEIRCHDSAAVNQFATRYGNNIEDVKVVDKRTVRLILLDTESKKVRLSEILPEIFNAPYEELDITRLSMYGWKGGWLMPMERNIVCLSKS